MTKPLSNQSINYNSERNYLMSKPEWGVKRLCQSCGARFYDMAKHPVVCPKCSTVFDSESSTKKRRGRPTQDNKVSLEPKEKKEELDLEEDLEPLTDDDDLLEDTSDFGEDEEVVTIESNSDED